MSGAGGYWLHANQSNSMTSNTIGVAGAANYYDGDYAVTQSGSYSSSQNYHSLSSPQHFRSMVPICFLPTNRKVKIPG